MEGPISYRSTACSSRPYPISALPVASVAHEEDQSLDGEAEIEDGNVQPAPFAFT